MPLLPRYTDTHLEDERKLARLILETGASVPSNGPGGFTSTDLRGIPAIGVGCPGRIRGSDPLGETIRRDEQRRRLDLG